MEVEIAAIANPASHVEEGRVARYAATLDEMPPVVVFEVEDGLLLVDGYHRVAAARRLGRATIDAEVITGSRADALAYVIKVAEAERGASRAQVLEAIKRRGASS